MEREGDDRVSVVEKTVRNARHPGIALVLQGGGALGSYQAGAYQALCHHNFEPEWIAGISIGAINAAIIAGVSLGVAAIAAGTGAFLLWDESADTADQRALVVEPGLGSLLLRGTF